MRATTIVLDEILYGLSGAFPRVQRRLACSDHATEGDSIVETNGYLHITADTHTEAGDAADRFMARAGLTTEYRTIDYSFALDIGAEITNDDSSAKIEVG